jgi:hypothetical protein
MKATFSSASFLLTVLAVAGMASAQGGVMPTAGLMGYGGGYGGNDYSYHSSTLEEGWLRGLGALALSEGQANYYNSLAAINGQTAYSRFVENRKNAVDAYFYMRQSNRAGREAARDVRLTREEYVTLAKKEAPANLTQQEYERTLGRIEWPAVLAGHEFAAERDAIDQIFRARSPGDFGAGSAFYGNVRQLTDAFQAKLKNKISDYDAAQYMAAKNFLRSLVYEAQQPVVVRALAAN